MFVLECGTARVAATNIKFRPVPRFSAGLTAFTLFVGSYETSNIYIFTQLLKCPTMAVMMEETTTSKTLIALERISTHQNKVSPRKPFSTMNRSPITTSTRMKRA